MKITFYKNETEREDVLAKAFTAGAKIFAHRACVEPVADFSEPDADVAVVVGVKSFATGIPQTYLEAKKRVVWLDKGHFGRGAYYRVSIDSFMPTRYLHNFNYPSDRFKMLGLYVKEMRGLSAGPIVFAGSSDKYARLRGLGGATEYARYVIDEIRDVTSRAIVYRPKPSWADALPIEGTTYSRPPRTFQEELFDAHCVIVHGSNAAIEALVEGVPAVVLGDGAALPLSAKSVRDIEGGLLWPSVYERLRWFNKLAYCQWTVQEFRSGKAWEVISEQLERTS